MGKGMFTPAEVVKAFDAGFLDEGLCRAWILERLHPDGAFCPGCGVVIDEEKRVRRFWAGGRLSCKECGKFFTASTGTFLSGAHLSYRKLMLMAFLMGTEASNRIVAATLGANPETVRIWKMKFNALGAVFE